MTHNTQGAINFAPTKATKQDKAMTITEQTDTIEQERACHIARGQLAEAFSLTLNEVNKEIERGNKGIMNKYDQLARVALLEICVGIK